MVQVYNQQDAMKSLAEENAETNEEK